MTEVQTTSVTDNVRVATYAIETIRELIPDWDRISRPERIAALEDLEPETEFSTHNVSTSTYCEYLAQLHNPEVNSQSVTWTHLAFGDDGTAESLGDEHLINEVYRDANDDVCVVRCGGVENPLLDVCLASSVDRDVVFGLKLLDYVVGGSGRCRDYSRVDSLRCAHASHIVSEDMFTIEGQEDFPGEAC